MPVPAFNDFNNLFDSLNSVGLESVVPFKTDQYTAREFPSKSWPVQAGNYHVFSPTSSVAVALLQGVSLNNLYSMGSPVVAIAGTITTENLGIEHLVKNVIANPHIRHLVLFGSEIQGHLPGDALLRLHDKGLNAKGHIISAQGARPVLKNITQVESEHFRAQVKITDLMEETDIDLLAERLSELGKLASRPYESGLRIDLVEVRKAEPARHLKLDHAGYFVIMVMSGKEQPLVVEHYTNDGALRNVIEGSDAASVCATLVDMKLISQLDHAAYIGRELARAELSLTFRMNYVQDKAQGHLDARSECG